VILGVIASTLFSPVDLSSPSSQDKHLPDGFACRLERLLYEGIHQSKTGPVIAFSIRLSVQREFDACPHRVHSQFVLAENVCDNG
jgi:hypothetical protein